MLRKILILSLSLVLLSNCASVSKTKQQAGLPFSLKFLQEKIIPAKMVFNNTVVGGLSSIDYVNGKYYAICDAKKTPRYYTLDFSINTSDKVQIKDVTFLQVDDEVDPEALRFDTTDQTVFWTSEGNIRKAVPPAIFKSDTLGNLIEKLPIPKIFLNTKNLYHNGTFEGLSLSKNKKSLWFNMELPFKSDGTEPTLINGKYPIRITKVAKKTGKLQKQFAYMLGKIPKDSQPKGKFRVNGVPEILALGNNHFLLLERAYASGYKNGGNTVRIYYVDSKDATDISKISSLKNTSFTPAKKILLFDFETIRNQLTNGIVDNIEGITFGPKLSNGNRTLILISDDNFVQFSKQLQQIIIFEVVEN
ncbi:MAG TPA: esterase-like activity of phytase family protein [Flavobacteriia bacterium]|nr:esterase-like activity of phytase family protein [Flavobacteriia bacterium]